jgi:hypothetical protein
MIKKNHTLSFAAFLFLTSAVTACGKKVNSEVLLGKEIPGLLEDGSNFCALQGVPYFPQEFPTGNKKTATWQDKTQEWGLPTDLRARTASVNDINNDGLPDIFIPGKDIFMNCYGAFISLGLYPPGFWNDQVKSNASLMYDLDNDGKLDLVLQDVDVRVIPFDQFHEQGLEQEGTSSSRNDEGGKNSKGEYDEHDNNYGRSDERGNGEEYDGEEKTGGSEGVQGESVYNSQERGQEGPQEVGDRLIAYMNKGYLRFRVKSVIELPSSLAMSNTISPIDVNRDGKAELMVSVGGLERRADKRGDGEPGDVVAPHAVNLVLEYQENSFIDVTESRGEIKSAGQRETFCVVEIPRKKGNILVVGNDKGNDFIFEYDVGKGEYLPILLEEASRWTATMGISWAYARNSEALDIILSNTGDPTLYRIHPDNTIEDRSSDLEKLSENGTPNIDVSWGIALRDFNNDRVYDILTATGRDDAFGFARAQHLQYYEGEDNESNTKYVDTSHVVGEVEPLFTTNHVLSNENYGLITADFNKDGCLDVLTTGLDSDRIDNETGKSWTAPVRLFEHQCTTSGNRVVLELQPQDEGALVEIAVSDGTIQYEALRKPELTGSSHQIVHVGLGENHVENVSVYWSDGRVSTTTDVPTNAYTKISK